MSSLLWFPFEGHPDGPSDVPWFRVTDSYGYRTPEHPAGESAAACFVVADGYAYPARGTDETTAPTFQIIGSFAYAPVGPAWFRIRNERGLRIVE